MSDQPETCATCHNWMAPHVTVQQPEGTPIRLGHCVPGGSRAPSMRKFDEPGSLTAESFLCCQWTPKERE